MTIARWQRGVVRRAAGVLAAACFIGSGCTSYERKPLDASAVNQALDPPGDEAIGVRAGELKHPILQPTNLNLADGLSPDEAAVLAVLLSPVLTAERDRMGVAESQLLQARLLPNPQLSASFDQPVAGSTAGTVTGWGLGLDYDLSALITHSADVDAAKAEAASVALDVAWREWQVAENAKLHAVRQLWLQRQLDEAARAEQQAQRHASTIQEAMQKGLITQGELDAATAQWQRFRILRLEADSAVESERLALNEALGAPAAWHLQIQETPTPRIPDEPGPDEIAADLDDHRLDLIALRLGYESEEARLRSAVLSQFPKISIGLAGAKDTSNVISIGPSVTLDLPVFDRAQGRIALEKATRQRLFDEYVARVFEARADVARLHAELNSVVGRIDASDAYVAGLQSLQAAYADAVHRGATDIIVINQVQSTLADARVESLKLRQEQAELLIGLEVARGQILASTSP